MRSTAAGQGDAAAFPHQLGEDARHRYPASERLPMTAVGHRHVILRFEGGDHANRDRLLSLAEMRCALDQVAQEQLLRLVLEEADAPHLRVPVLELAGWHQGLSDVGNDSSKARQSNTNPARAVNWTAANESPRRRGHRTGWGA